MVNKNNNSSQEVMKNALILYTAFYSNDKEITDPSKIPLPTSLMPKQNINNILTNSKVYNQLPNGFQIFLALFKRDSDIQKYSIHGLWLNKYNVYQNTINLIEVNSKLNSNNGFLIHKINPSIISECNKLWSSGSGYPPSVELWNHEWIKHGTAIENNIFKSLKPDQFLLTVLDLYKNATKEINGKSLADNFSQNSKKGETFLIPLTLSLKFEYTKYSENVEKQLKCLEQRGMCNV